MTGKEGTVEELTRPQLEEYRKLLNGTDQGIPTLGEVLRIFEWDGRGSSARAAHHRNQDLLRER